MRSTRFTLVTDRTLKSTNSSGRLTGNVVPRKTAPRRGHRAHPAVPALPGAEGDGPLRLQVVGGVRSGCVNGVVT